MKKKIIFICDPGIGILDNSLSFLSRIDRNKYDIELLTIKNGFIRQFSCSDFITTISDELFSKVYFVENNKFYISNSISNALKVFNNFKFFNIINYYVNKIIFILFKKKILIHEKLFNYISFNIKIKIKSNFIKKINNHDAIFENVGLIIYDIVSQKSKNIEKFKKKIENINKLSIYHGSDFQCLEKKKNNDQVIYEKNCHQIIFTNTEYETNYYNHYYKFDNDFLSYGNPKFSNTWINFVLKNGKKDNFLNEKFVFIISRPADDKYFSINKKIQYLKDIKKIIVDELKYKLIFRLHPKESEEFNSNVLEEIFKKKNYKKTWQISTLNPYVIGKHAQFAISFFSGLAVDLWHVGCPTVEYMGLNDLNFDNLKIKDPIFLDNVFLKNNDYVLKIRLNDLVMGASNVHQLKENINLILLNKPDIVKKHKKIIEDIYFNKEESVNKILTFIEDKYV